MTYFERPAVVEAVQYTGDVDSINAIKAMKAPVVEYTNGINLDLGGREATIAIGDWIVRKGKYLFFHHYSDEEFKKRFTKEYGGGK